MLVAVDEWLYSLPYELGMGFMVLWRILMFRDNLIWCFELLAMQFTDLFARNLQLERDAQIFRWLSQFMEIGFMMTGLCHTGPDELDFWFIACLTPYVFAASFLYNTCIDPVTSHRDRLITSGIMFAAFGIQVYIMIVVGPVSLTPWGCLSKLMELGSI
jgi:hypothetical protein